MKDAEYLPAYTIAELRQLLNEYDAAIKGPIGSTDWTERFLEWLEGKGKES